MATVTENSGQTAKDSGSGSDSGPGEPAEAVPALVAELVKAPAALKPDENVSTAVAAGWHAREALTAAQQADNAAVEPEMEKEKAHPPDCGRAPGTRTSRRSADAQLGSTLRTWILRPSRMRRRS